MTDDGRWQDRAACADTAGAWSQQEEQLEWRLCKVPGCGRLHPVGTGVKRTKLDERRHKRERAAVCRTCPVLTECEAYTLSLPRVRIAQSDEVWAGRTGRVLRRWYDAAHLEDHKTNNGQEPQAS